MHLLSDNLGEKCIFAFYGLFMYRSKGLLLVLFYIECFHSRIYSARAEFFFDAEKLVVFSNTLGSAWCTCLNLACIQCYCKVSDCCICCLTGTVGRDCCVACFVSHLDCFQCFGYRTDLV